MSSPPPTIDEPISMNPVETFEKAFQACLSVVTKEDTLTNTDHDEVRVDAEIAIQELMDKARAMEGYFLRKRLHIAHLKPELVLKDDSLELKVELQRKEELLRKNFDKIAHWQNILSDVQSNTTIGGGGAGAGNIINVKPPGVPMGPHSGHGLLPQPSPLGRPQTPASVGPPTPGQASMMQGGPPSVPPPGSRPLSFAGQIPQGGGGPSGLQGPLAFLEKTASTIGTGSDPSRSGMSAASRRGRPKKVSSFDPTTGQPLPSSPQDPQKPKRIYRRKSKPSADESSNVSTPDPSSSSGFLE